MKRFLLKLGLFFIAIIVVDRSLGMVFSYMGDHAKGGYIGHHKYVTNKLSEDILVFGSSRAIHHYNPQIISDSLGLTCYNCGQDGNGIILFYGLWQMIKQHYKPKMIIYDVTPAFDIYEGDANQRYLGWLRADYDMPGIKELFWNIDPTEKYKMMSMLYRYNSKFIQNIIDYVHPLFLIKCNGYLPLVGKMDKMKTNYRKRDIPKEKDSLKMDYLNRFIEETVGIKMVFIASPSWYKKERDSFEEIRNLCAKRSIDFVDFSDNIKFVHQDKYFKDGVHLNSLGADEFSRDIIPYLK